MSLAGATSGPGAKERFAVASAVAQPDPLVTVFASLWRRSSRADRADAIEAELAEIRTRC